MDYCRGIVARIFALKQWLRHTGFAQIAINIASAHAFIDGIFKSAAHNAHILPHIGKNNGKAGVLTNGNVITGRDCGIFQQLLKNVFTHGRGFRRMRPVHAVHHILRQAAAGAHRKVGNRARYVLNIDFLHVFLFISKTAAG